MVRPTDPARTQVMAEVRHSAMTHEPRSSSRLDSQSPSERLLGQQRRSLTPRGEEEALDRDQSSDIAHVALELRDDDRVIVVEFGRQAPYAGGVAPRERTQVSQRRTDLAAGSASPPKSTARADSSIAGDVRASTRTRLTIRPPNGMPASRSRRRKKIASATGAGSGDAMIRKVVAGSPRSRLTALARSANPSTTPLSARKNAPRSASRSTPVTWRWAEKTRPLPRAAIAAAAPAGAVSSFSERPSR